MEAISRNATCGTVAGDTAGCGGLQQFLECLPALRLLLSKGFKVQLLLIVQVEKCLVLELVVSGEELDVAEWVSFHGCLNPPWSWTILKPGVYGCRGRF